MNKFGYFIILLLIFSCQNERDVLKNHSNYLLDEINIENNYETSSFEYDIYSKKLTYDSNEEIERITTNYYSIDSALKNTIDWNLQKLLHVRNDILFNVADRKVGKKYFTVDTINMDLEKSNPKDTLLLNSIIRTSKLLAKSINRSQINIQLSHYNRKGLFMMHNRFVHCGFNKIDKKIKYTNKIFYQNEKVYIIPSFFEVDNYNIAPIHIFKENSDQFIMENGKKKTFTNPISLKASSIKGVHTVKGIIMIKQWGELVPKPFEFRYIVD